MNSNYDKQLKTNLNTLNKINAMLLHNPDGELGIRRHRSGHQYWINYSVTDHKKQKEEYIKKVDSEKLSLYAKKFYLKKLKKEIENENDYLQIACKYRPDGKGLVFDELPAELKQYIKPLFRSVTSQVLDWHRKDYQRNPYAINDNASYTTKAGELVRSRAELIIANELTSFGLLYHYEEALTLQSGKIKYPDFKIAHPETGEFYYIEFFGMMDNPDYASSAFKKINEYSQDPVFSKMIYIFDYPGAPFNNTSLQQIIRNIFFS